MKVSREHEKYDHDGSHDNARVCLEGENTVLMDMKFCLEGELDVWGYTVNLLEVQNSTRLH